MTTNLAFKQRNAIFPTATCAHALIERVVHHADVVKIEGESYRLRRVRARGLKREANTASTKSKKTKPKPNADG